MRSTRSLAWGITLFIIVLAVWLTAVPLRDYLGWVRPRAVDILLGVAVIVVLYAILVLLLFSSAIPLRSSKITGPQ